MLSEVLTELCEKYAHLEIQAHKLGRPVIRAKDPEIRKCVERRVREKTAMAQVHQYEPIAWALIQKYPAISDANLRQKIRNKLPNDPKGQEHVFSMVRSRSYKAMAFSGAQLKAMTKMMESTHPNNIDTHRRHLETLPRIQAASEMNNRKRALFKKLNARHATLRATWAARKQSS